MTFNQSIADKRLIS